LKEKTIFCSVVIAMFQKISAERFFPVGFSQRKKRTKPFEINPKKQRPSNVILGCNTSLFDSKQSWVHFGLRVGRKKALGTETWCSIDLPDARDGVHQTPLRLVRWIRSNYKKSREAAQQLEGARFGNPTKNKTNQKASVNQKKESARCPRNKTEI
jgi:hypothetical protein